MDILNSHTEVADVYVQDQWSNGKQDQMRSCCGAGDPDGSDGHRAARILHGLGSQMFTGNRWFDKVLQVVIDKISIR